MKPKPSFSVSTVAPEETMASKAGSTRLVVPDCGACALSARKTDPLTRAALQTTKTFMVNPRTYAVSDSTAGAEPSARVEGVDRSRSS